MQSAGLMFFWLLVVLALIPLSVWLLKRSGLAGVTGATNAALLKPVAQLSLGPGQRVVAVELVSGEERTWLVLGVTQHQITTLHTMAAPPGGALNLSNMTSSGVSPAVVSPVPFAQWLRRSSNRTQAPDA